MAGNSGGGYLRLTSEQSATVFASGKTKPRQREGIAAAKARGQHLGRPGLLKPAQVKELRKRVAAGEDKAQVSQAFGISRATVYNYMS